MTSEIKHIDAASANHRVASKAELYLLNYSAVIKAVKISLVCRSRYQDRLSYREYKGKTISFLPFHFRAFHVRQPSQGACPIALTTGDTLVLCSEPGLTADLRKSFSASKAEKF